MFDYIHKPEDYDSVIHGETRFVIFEKNEEVSCQFNLKLLYYCQITVGKTLSILNSIIDKNGKI